MRDIKNLEEAFTIEKETMAIAETCYHFFKQSGQEDMAETMKMIVENETRHIEEISKLLHH